MWFEELTGFQEGDVDDVASQFVLDGPSLTSRANGRRMTWGRFELVRLNVLRDRVADTSTAAEPSTGMLKLREVVADVQDLHLDPANAGAMFQVASQFNTLEMVSPSVRPEDGIDRYESDRTQGPACAVACGAGTIYRNYLVDVDGGQGQSEQHQLDGLAHLATALGETIAMTNGYAFPTASQLDRITARLDRFGLDDDRRRRLAGELAIGMQWDTEVTLAPGGAGPLVSQAYCSALPVAYSSVPVSRWEAFARLVLDAAYEATLAAAVVNARATGNKRVYLTLLGGGVFGNRIEWIIDAIVRAAGRYHHHDLDVAIVSFGRSNPDLMAKVMARRGRLADNADHADSAR